MPGKPATWGSLCILTGSIEGLWVLGEHAEAAALYPLLAEIGPGAGDVVRVYDFRLNATLLGIAAMAGGDLDRAEEHFVEGNRLERVVSGAVGGAENRRFYAEMLVRRDAPGDRDNARTMLEEALDVYRTVGMPRHIEMAEAVLKEL
jgi:hypothetical protein